MNAPQGRFAGILNIDGQRQKAPERRAVSRVRLMHSRRRKIPAFCRKRLLSLDRAGHAPRFSVKIPPGAAFAEGSPAQGRFLQKNTAAPEKSLWCGRLFPRFLPMCRGRQVHTRSVFWLAHWGLDKIALRLPPRLPRKIPSDRVAPRAADSCAYSFGKSPGLGPIRALPGFLIAAPAPGGSHNGRHEVTYAIQCPKLGQNKYSTCPAHFQPYFVGFLPEFFLSPPFFPVSLPSPPCAPLQKQGSPHAPGPKAHRQTNAIAAGPVCALIKKLSKRKNRPGFRRSRGGKLLWSFRYDLIVNYLMM